MAVVCYVADVGLECPKTPFGSSKRIGRCNDVINNLKCVSPVVCYGNFDLFL